MVYLIHFNKPLKHATHYIGFVESDLHNRVKKHKNGTGAKILRAANQHGIDWKVVKTWSDGDRNFERKLKNQKNAKCHCPICRSTTEYNGYKIVDNYCKSKGCKTSHLKITNDNGVVLKVIRYRIDRRSFAIERAKKFIDNLNKTK